ncbi:MAG: ATP-dependent DNA helicase RecQ [Myxococcota bacterium]
METSPPNIAEPLAPSDKLHAALALMGFERFKPGQREVVEAVLAGRDALAIMPTGAGKSLCYQLPSLLLPDVTLVVSPLIALIRDQVARATARGLPVVSLTSHDGREERSQKLARIARKEARLVYAAPEGLRSQVVLAALKEAGVSLLCVDEAHCISAWGHDFRPDYARLGALRALVEPRSLLAVTATATPLVRQDILRSLSMTDAATVVTGFDRPNLRLAVTEVKGPDEKLEVIRRTLQEELSLGGSAIVYCNTRKNTEELTVALGARGVRAVAYHAGMSPPAREEAQGQWERGEVPTICATNAFGMGVDKPDVRVVMHHALPRSPEAYYQEVGRAGRDGLSALGLLLFDAGDIRFARRMLEQSCPDEQSVWRAWEAARRFADQDGICAPSLDALAERVAPAAGPAARAAVIHLLQAGALVQEGQGMRLAGGELHVNAELLEARARAEERKLHDMLAYVQRATCRQAALVTYFSAGDATACGRCDLCVGGSLREVAGEQRLDVLKALSCVARMLGRYGRVRVAEVLLGSHARPVVEAGLDKLSTWGLFRNRKRAEVLELLNALERAGLVVGTVGEYPTLDLTEAGTRVLKDGVVPPMWLPRAPAEVRPVERAVSSAAVGEEPPISAEDSALVEALRTWRGSMARSLRVPPYILMNDRTLKAVAALKPRTPQELMQVPGMGRVKVDKYGAAILAVVRGA